MKICVAQTRPFKGDIGSNISMHVKLTEEAIAHGAALIVFPELSITSYEPTLARELATTPHDSRFDVFQELSDKGNITIGIGLPTRWPEGLCISMLIFRPKQARQLYFKKYLHADEVPFFVSKESSPNLKINNIEIALAICYEVFIPEHTQVACGSGAGIYLASVAKSVKGIDKGLARLSEIARSHSMLVLMANCVGEADGMVCAGKSAAWNVKGELLGQLDGSSEGILVLDTETQEVTTALFAPATPLASA